jgi:hypothetical protein
MVTKEASVLDKVKAHAGKALKSLKSHSDSARRSYRQFNNKKVVPNSSIPKSKRNATVAKAKKTKKMQVKAKRHYISGNRKIHPS